MPATTFIWSYVLVIFITSIIVMVSSCLVSRVVRTYAVITQLDDNALCPDLSFIRSRTAVCVGLTYSTWSFQISAFAALIVYFYHIFLREN